MTKSSLRFSQRRSEELHTKLLHRGGLAESHIFCRSGAILAGGPVVTKLYSENMKQKVLKNFRYRVKP